MEIDRKKERAREWNIERGRRLFLELCCEEISRRQFFYECLHLEAAIYHMGRAQNKRSSAQNNTPYFGVFSAYLALSNLLLLPLYALYAHFTVLVACRYDFHSFYLVMDLPDKDMTRHFSSCNAFTRCPDASRAQHLFIHKFNKFLNYYCNLF